MSGDDDKERGGEVVNFPRVFFPGSFDAPAESERGPVDDGGQAAPVGSMRGLPGVERMAPPLALTMPGVPTPSDDGEGFTPPSPADPDNPTGREMVQVCMAIVTAMGVAAAQAMWQRARQRQARADRGRQSGGERTHTTRSASTGHSGGSSRRGSSSTGGGLLTGSPHEGTSRRKRPGSGDKRRPGGHGSDKRDRRDRDTSGHKTHRSARDGRPVAEADRKRRKRRGPGDGACVQTRERRTDSKGGKQDPSKASKDNKGGTSAEDTPKRRTLRWKAPAKSNPGPDGDKALPAGRKRWDNRTTPKTDKPKADQAKSNGKRRTRRLRWESTPTWLKDWRARRTAASSSRSSSSTRPADSTTAAGTPRDDGPKSSAGAPPPPPRGAEWMRPPPGADRRVRITVERVDERPRPRPRPESAALSGAAGRAALAPANSSTTTETTQSTGGHMSTQTGPSVPAPRMSTQYADADLTIHDVIEADADMAEEITAGVDEARATADGCERLLTKLEALHAEIVDLKVPGVLAGMFMRLMDKTLSVKARAEAIAANLPAAAEAIQTAGSNAAARHKPLADAVKDAGHIRPAEREYHDE